MAPYLSEIIFSAHDLESFSTVYHDPALDQNWLFGWEKGQRSWRAFIGGFPAVKSWLARQGEDGEIPSALAHFHHIEARIGPGDFRSYAICRDWPAPSASFFEKMRLKPVGLDLEQLVPLARVRLRQPFYGEGNSWISFLWSESVSARDFLMLPCARYVARQNFIDSRWRLSAVSLGGGRFYFHCLPSPDLRRHYDLKNLLSEVGMFPMMKRKV